jgi:hypothetical protein
MDKKTMYFMDYESKGFLEPKLSTQNLEPHQVEAFLAQAFTNDAWVEIFQLMAGVFPQTGYRSRMAKQVKR